MSRRHEHRRAARREARRPIFTRHGKALFTVDRLGRTIRTVDENTARDAFDEDTPLEVLTGVTPFDGLQSWPVHAYRSLLVRHPGRLWTPDNDHEPAAIIGGACEHIRVATAQHFGFLTPGLAADFKDHPDWWLCWIAVPHLTNDTTNERPNR